MTDEGVYTLCVIPNKYKKLSGGRWSKCCSCRLIPRCHSVFLIPKLDWSILLGGVKEDQLYILHKLIFHQEPCFQNLPLGNEVQRTPIPFLNREGGDFEWCERCNFMQLIQIRDPLFCVRYWV